MLDRAGILGSAVCVAHCSLPLVLGFTGPSASSLFGNEWIHIGLLITVIPIALFSFLNTRKKVGNITPLTLGTVGVLLLITAVTAGHQMEDLVPNFELTCTVLGSLVLISAHILNLKIIKKT